MFAKGLFQISSHFSRVELFRHRPILLNVCLIKIVFCKPPNHGFMIIVHVSVCQERWLFTHVHVYKLMLPIFNSELGSVTLLLKVIPGEAGIRIFFFKFEIKIKNKF